MSEFSAPDRRALRRQLRDLRERADYLDHSGTGLMRKYGKTLREDIRLLLQDQLATMRGARIAAGGEADAAAVERLERAVNAFDEALHLHLGTFRKSPTREYVEAIAWAALLTIGIRAFVFEAFKIPTGSMIPTLQVHDHLFVNKFLYGLKIPFTRIKFLALRDPRPGEVVVFEYPYDDDPDSTGKDLIKRVIAAPGDKVRMADNVLYLNGKPVKRHIVAAAGSCGKDTSSARMCRVARECIGGQIFTTQHHVSPAPEQYEVDNTPDWPWAERCSNKQWHQCYGPHAMVYAQADNRAFPDFEVPPGQLLVMGDNRDNSKDGRFFGLVPMEVVKGKAGIRWWAFSDDWFKPTTERMFTFVHDDEAPGGDCEQWNPGK